MNQTFKRTIQKTLVQLLLDLKKQNELENFLADFFSESELETYAKRLSIAYWLKKGRDNQNIKTNLQVTQKEIDDVKKKLGSKGLKIAIKYLEAEEWANVWSKKIKNLTSKR